MPEQADPQQILESVFGYREFRPGQRHIIDAVLGGRDCIGVMPTGAGKSLTFQIPARILPGAVLVISPLISLMKDQVDALERLGYRAAVINSTHRRPRSAASGSLSCVAGSWSWSTWRPRGSRARCAPSSPAVP